MIDAMVDSTIPLTAAVGGVAEIRKGRALHLT